MRKPSLAGLTALALTGGTLLGTMAPAQAADPSVLYVAQNAPTGCSDTYPGTQEQPFCTVGAAAAVVTAGQTVDVSGGTYRERVTIPASGTPDQPITFRAPPSGVTLVGPTAGFVVDGQHDIRIQNFRVNGPMDVPALDVRAASEITIEGLYVYMGSTSTAPAARLTGVTDSSLKRVTLNGAVLVGGLAMDADTTGTTVTSSTVTSGASTDTGTDNVGIQVGGSGNTIVNNLIGGFAGSAITLDPGAAGTVVANNQVNGGAGYGIRNHAATGTAITNNTVRDRCLDGIRVEGASTGVSVQNNVLTSNGYFGQSYCDPAKADGVELGVYGDATRDTVIDYNNAFHHWSSPSSIIYSWNGTRMSVANFRTASGQAAHDSDTPYTSDNYDSANSAAPGYQATDRVGTPRADDPAVADTGAGPVTYADRGATETIRNPVARMKVTLDLGASTVTVDASTSQPGFVPIASYRFEFGDGTVVTQDTPVASHRYATRSTFDVKVRVTGTDDRYGTISQEVSVLPRTATVGLLALANLRYVTPLIPGTNLRADHAALEATDQFDLVDAGNGQVALFSRAAQGYVGYNSSDAQRLSVSGTVVATNQKFVLLRNTDGTISLRSVANNLYVSTPSAGADALVASRSTIGPWEKFHRVTVTDANRWLKARVNSRYVTAESAGTKPLIANRTSVGPWERFDVIDLGNGQVALFARANNRFVSADSKGTLPLIANRTAVGAWERFTLIRNSDGTVSLKAAVNSRYVSADGAGAKPLIANRTAIGLWEKFTLG